MYLPQPSGRFRWSRGRSSSSPRPTGSQVSNGKSRGRSDDDDDKSVVARPTKAQYVRRERPATLYDTWPKLPPAINVFSRFVAPTTTHDRRDATPIIAIDRHSISYPHKTAGGRSTAHKCGQHAANYKILGIPLQNIVAMTVNCIV